MSECKTFSVAQWISTGFSRRRTGFDITTGSLLEVLKVNLKYVLSLSTYVRMVFFLWFLWFFKDYKPEVPSHNSFESQLCGTLKNPHAIRKEKGTEFSAVLWFVLEIQGHCRDLGFVSFFLSRRAMVILKV